MNHTRIDALAARRNGRGFTLIEIMVVVIIIGLLAAFVVPQFLGRVDDARLTKAKGDIQALETALTMYKLDNFSYPNTDVQPSAALSTNTVSHSWPFAEWIVDRIR